MLALLANFLLVGVLLVFLLQQLTNHYQHEVEQKLHLDLARHIVDDHQLFKNDVIDPRALKDAFHNMMILGPSFEFYVIDPAGKLVSYAAEEQKIKRHTVNLQPVWEFLSKDRRLPITGDDPRHPFRQKIFSAAELHQDGQPMGYLYIIIGGEIYDGVSALIRQSHNMKLGVGVLTIALCLSLLAALGLFAVLTRPLRRLSRDIDHFRAEGFDANKLTISAWDAGSSDEIERLGSSFTIMAEELKHQYEKVKAADELRRELVSHVSHDLRTPLASLKGYLETWQIKQGSMSEAESQKLIDTAARNALQMGVLVEQLFELAHLEGDANTLNWELVSIAELAQDVLQKLALRAEAKQITLTLEPKNPALLVQADIEKLERVFTNLVDNAIRHCAERGQVDIVMEASKEQIRVSVQDNGSGIPAAEVGKIFNAHFRASNSAAGSGEKHSGLGLAITRRILDLHGSRIEVLTELGEGTRFSFTLNRPASQVIPLDSD